MYWESTNICAIASRLKLIPPAISASLRLWGMSRVNASACRANNVIGSGWNLPCAINRDCTLRSTDSAPSAANAVEGSASGDTSYSVDNSRSEMSPSLRTRARCATCARRERSNRVRICVGVSRAPDASRSIIVNEGASGLSDIAAPTVKSSRSVSIIS